MIDDEFNNTHSYEIKSVAMYMKEAFIVTIFIFIILVLFSGIFAAKSPDSAEIPINKELTNRNAILLKNAQFDTSIPQPGIVSEDILSISQYPDNVDGYYIIQFSGHIREEWKQVVRDTGAVIYDYVPNNAFVVRMNTTVKSRVESLDKVQWIGIYQPSYRVCPLLSSVIYSYVDDNVIKQEGSAGEEAVREDIIVLLFDANDNERVLSEIENLGGDIVDNAGDIIRVRIDGAKIGDIAIINGVSWIEKYVQPILLNDVAANITDVYDVRNTYGLTGSGQIVAVADSGLDTGVDDTSMHDDIEGRIAALHAWWSGYGDTGAEDNGGHGTHVAGSVLGNGFLSNGKYAGIAPEAQLVFQALQYEGEGPLVNGSFYVPTNLSLLFQEAYVDNAKIHSNSWGSDVGGDYTTTSQKTDQFAWNNKDFVIVFAAGNGDNFGIYAPGTAKNTITVGASENYRPPDSRSDNIDEIAYFSSIGPTDDNRIKPDVVAPGTFIISTRSSMPCASYLWGILDNYYAYSSGTSMSTPLTSGTMALIRQYYVDNESISPSAALLKATLINGAADLSLPSSAQGWGRVDIERSLFPALPRTMHYYDSISLNTSESWNVSYYVNETSETLKITLVWTDYPGATFANPTLVNNLDLTVTGPGGTYYGNGALDIVNNVEQVELSSPPVGLYTIKVNGTNIPEPSQPFALVISFAIEDKISPSVSDEFPANNSYTTNSTTTVAVNITDSGLGVNLSSINMTINDLLVTFTNTTIPNGYRIQNITSVPYSDGIINVSINVTDNASNSMTYNWSFTIDATPPNVTDPNATPTTIESNGTDKTNLSVIVIDYLTGVANVTINLTQVGGSATAEMRNLKNTYWIITNTTGVGNGTYDLPVNATDTAGNSNTCMNITLYVNDTTPPILSRKIPLTGTTNHTPTISINATDRGSGINASSAEMTIDGIHVTCANISSGFTFNFTNTTSAYNHGETVNVRFNVSDNEGHIANTSWLFYIDNLTPTVTITSPEDGYSTTASSITVAGFVNGTGSPPITTVNDIIVVNTANSTIFNGTFSTTVSILVGSNTIYANVTDAAGNTESTLINIIRNTISKPTNGGGGGGGGGSTGEERNNILEENSERINIFQGDSVSYSFEGISIISINFTSKINAGWIKSTIEVLKNTSTLVNTSAPQNVYQNVNIWVGLYGWADEQSIANALISFKVPIEWIKSNNIDEGSIKLYRYNNNTWNPLPTTRINKDSMNIYYNSQTPGFSPFAISGKSNPTVLVKQVPLPTPAIIENNSSHSNNQVLEIENQNHEGNIILWVLAIIILLSIVAVVAEKMKSG